MRSEILMHLLVSLLSVTTQNIEPENSTVEASSSSSLSPSSKFNSEPETTPLPLERSFVIQKLAETIAPRERGFPLPEIKRARELSTAEKEPLSTTLPFIVEIDRSTNSEVKSDHPNYQNSTEQEGRNNYEVKKISISSITEIPKLSFSTINGTEVITEHIGNEDETLPPEVRAADPFATTITDEPTILMSPTSSRSILDMIQNNSSSKMNFMSNEAVKVSQTFALDTDRTYNATSSSLKPEQEMVINKTTDGTTMAVEIQKMSQETEVIVSEEQKKSTDSYTAAVFETLITGTTPDIFRTTVSNIVTSVEQTRRIPLYPIVSHTFNLDSDEQSTTTREVLTDRTTAVGMSQELGKYHTSPVTESILVDIVPSITSSESTIHSSPVDAFVTESVSAEIKHKSELPQETATNGFNADKSQEGEHDHEHEDESLFVGDKTLFSQDGIMKSDFRGMHSATGFTMQTETSEENFGVPGFSRVEGLGPEATEEIHEARIDVVTGHPSTIQSKIRTNIPVDLTENFDELNDHHNDEKLETTKNFFIENEDVKDISVVDDSFYHTDIEGVASTFRPTTDERKLESEPKPTSQPEPVPGPVPFPESGISETSKGSPEPVVAFKPKDESEFIAVPEGFEGNENDLNSILHTHHMHVTDSHKAKEAYKTPFSFRITSIDYIPEFGDSNSGKYKKLHDQLVPDLEEIFGSIFGHIYDGIHLVSFLKGSVIVDGIVYTSKKPDNMEQSATEFEQQITAKNSQIGGNDVDPRSISLDGFVSKNYVERVHEGYTSSSTSSYIVGGGIAIGILAILLIAFTVIAGRKTDYPFTNNRRTNGTLKLKEENIAMADNNRSVWQNGTSPVNLMSYGNGRMIQGGTTTNTQPPMVMVGSQMSTGNTHANNRVTQPHP